MNSNEDETLDLIDVELDLSDEVWKELDGYNGRYSLSNYGRVRNNESGRFLMLEKSGKQIRISLANNGVDTHLKIQDAVTSYFPTANRFNPVDYKYLNRISKTVKVLDSLDGELWAEVNGYEGLYQVSTMGRIKGLARTVTKTAPSGKQYPYVVEETIKVLGDTGRGYLQISLCKGGKKTMWRVHRLVAQAFIPNPENKPQVNHIDGDKANNIVTNLEWNTSEENIRHAHSNGLSNHPKGEDSATAKLTWNDIRYIRNSNGLSQTYLAGIFRVSSATIGRIMRNESYIDNTLEETK